MLNKIKKAVNFKYFLCFTELLTTLKVCREAGDCDLVSLFGLMFVYLLFLSKDGVEQYKNASFHILETLFLSLLWCVVSGFCPARVAGCSILAGVVLQVFRAPQFYPEANVRSLIGRDYQSFSAYGALLLSMAAAWTLPVDGMLAVLIGVSVLKNFLVLLLEKRQKTKLNGPKTIIGAFAKIGRSPLLMRSVTGTSWIWSISFLMLLNMVAIDSVWRVSVLFVAAIVLFWAGYSYAKRLSKHIVDLTFMPMNIALMTISLTVLSVVSFMQTESLLDEGVFVVFWMLNAFSAGMYTFPMIVQMRAKVKPMLMEPVATVSRAFDALCFGIVVAGTFFRYELNASVGWIFAFGAVVAAGILIYHHHAHPSAIYRSAVRVLFEIMFDVTVKGQTNFRQAGHRVLIVANHASSIDALLIAAFMPERISVVLPLEAKSRLFTRICRLFADVHVVDVKDAMALRPIIALLKQNRKVLVFPEGRSSVTGSVMKVYAGVGVIAENANASILPICITGAQYSKFSFQKGLHKTHLFPKVRLSIMPSRKLSADHLDDKRKRNYSISLQLYRMMSDMMVEAFNSNRNLYKALWDAKTVFGGHREIAEDSSRATLTYNKLLLKSQVLGRAAADLFKGEEYVGVMMPNALANLVLYFALIAADKVPAMLNFSSGSAQILSCMKAVGIKSVVTAHAFVEAAKLEPVIAALEENGVRLVYLDEMAKNLSAGVKIRGVFRHLFSIMPKRKANQASTVLFTSGSEGHPKAVLLSHTNFLINGYQAVVEEILTPRDIIFNALPMFHSFGLGVATLLPVVNGMKTVLYPSPLHYRVIPELIYDTNATVLFGTDTFLAGYGNAAHPYDFYSLRLAIVGAEKLKESTEKLYIEKFSLRIMEGYGATECSPLVSVNSRMYAKRGSVGRIVPALEYRLDPVEGIKEGKKLVVRGKNVMMGYMRADNPGVLDAPKDGWYDTGDIVEVDDEDFIFIKGRAKRFAKVGGEMISLPAIETAVNELYPETMNAVVAVADEKKGEKLVLFTTCQTAESAAVKAFIRQKGLSDLGAPSQIVPVAELPLIGSGKIDYVTLKKMAEEKVNDS